MLELIQQEQREHIKLQAQLIEWQTKHICAMFASNAQDKKQAKAIAKMVEKIKLPLGDEEADVIDTRSDEEIHEFGGGNVDLDSQPAFEMLEAALQHI